jgi:hypothetical protein
MRVGCRAAYFFFASCCSNRRASSIAGLGSKSSSSNNRRSSITPSACSPCGAGHRFAHSSASSFDFVWISQ